MIAIQVEHSGYRLALILVQTHLSETLPSSIFHYKLRNRADLFLLQGGEALGQATL